MRELFLVVEVVAGDRLAEQREEEDRQEEEGERILLDESPDAHQWWIRPMIEK